MGGGNSKKDQTEVIKPAVNNMASASAAQ